jgi:hypothetical protein
LTTKMLASTVQFSNNTPPTTHTHHLHQHNHTHRRSHTQHGLVEDGTGQKQQPLPKEAPPPAGKPTTGGRVVLSGPNRMSSPPHHPANDSPLHTRTRSLEQTGRTRETPHRRCDLPASPPYEPRRHTYDASTGPAHHTETGMGGAP